MVVGEHCKFETLTTDGAVMVMAAVADDPLSEAVTVADWLDVTDPPTTVKLATFEPAATVTEEGVVNAELLSLSDTDIELDPACARVTVQVEAAPEAMLLGEHCKLDTVGSSCVTLIVPLLAETVAGFPFGRAPIALPTVIGTDVPAVEVSDIVTVATTPLPTAVLFIPVARQVVEPLAEPHVRLLPAAVNAVPAVTFTDATLAVAYESCHCKPAGALLDAFNERFSVTVPP